MSLCISAASEEARSFQPAAFCGRLPFLDLNLRPCGTCLLFLNGGSSAWDVVEASRVERGALHTKLMFCACVHTIECGTCTQACVNAQVQTHAHAMPMHMYMPNCMSQFLSTPTRQRMSTCTCALVCDCALEQKMCIWRRRDVVISMI